MNCCKITILLKDFNHQVKSLIFVDFFIFSDMLFLEIIPMNLFFHHLRSVGWKKLRVRMDMRY